MRGTVPAGGRADPGDGGAGPRLLHVVNSLEVGGVEVGVANLVRGLHEAGYRQALWCVKRPGPLCSTLPESVPVFCAGPPAGGPAPCGAAVWRSAAWLRRWQPGVVHVRNCGAWHAALPAWALAGCPGRLVASIHGLDWVQPLGPARAALMRGLALTASALVAVSEVTARQFAAQSGVPAARFEVLHSGVDTRRFHPAAGAGNRDDPAVVLGCVARLGQQKGHDILLEAFAAARRLGTPAMRLELAGDGPFRARLEARARHLGLADVVRFHGECADVAGLLRRVDLFVLASLQEGRPTSIMEAMASGLPVVATDVGAVAGLVQHGSHGLLVPPGQAAALAEAIAALARDPARRRAMGEAGRRFAVDHCSLAAMVGAYDRFYRRVGASRSWRLAPPPAPASARPPPDPAAPSAR